MKKFRHRGVPCQLWGGPTYFAPGIEYWERMGPSDTSEKEAMESARRHIDYIIECYKDYVRHGEGR